MYKCNRPGCNKTAYIQSSLTCTRCAVYSSRPRRTPDEDISYSPSYVTTDNSNYPSISITPDTSSSCDSSSYDSGSSSSDGGSCSSD